MTNEETQELRAIYERLGRLLANAAPPSNVEYDRSRLQEPPKAAEPAEVRCNCNLPAEYKTGNSNGRDWAGWFCNRPKKDPKNCGFRKWVD